MTVEVFTWEPHAYSGKPLLCLHEKQVPYSHHYIDIGQREHHEPAFLAINPVGTVPALVHDGLVLTESTPMMEYIDDAFAGPSLRPGDAALRWRMRWIMRVVDNSLCPSLEMIASNALATPRGEIDESQRRVTTGIALLERMLREFAHLAGPEFSLADIGAMATLYHLPISRPDAVSRQLTPRLWRWLARCHARPGLKAGFAAGRGAVTARAREARLALGLKE